MSILNRSTRFIQWLWIGKYHILTFAVIVVTVLYLMRFINYHPSSIALCLSLLGLALIYFQQIIDATEYADHKPNTIRNWFKACPFIKKLPLNVTRSAFVTASGKRRVPVSVAPDASLENKVEFLIQQNETLQIQLSKVDDRVDDVYRVFRDNDKRISSSIANLSSALRDRIASHIIGTYDLNLLGLTLTLCGTLIQFFCQ